MIRKRILLTLITIFVYATVNAQTPKSFTHEPVTFLSEMQAFLAATNKKDAEKLIEKFTIPWNGGKFSANQQETIYNTCDAMQKKRLKAYPDFSNYLNALLGFSESGQNSQSFDGWHSGINKMLKGSTRNFSNYLEVCYDLFQTNTLYASSSTVWKASSNNYTFDFDSLPKIVFGNTTLTCIAKGDSSIINNTKGSYYPNIRKFYGSGGVVNWSRAELPPNEVYAELKNYTIDVSGADYDADSVTFYNKKIFSQPLTGRLYEKILANSKGEDASYPRFSSYDTDLEIKELIKDADYKGGFSMYGSRIIGSGGRSRNASLTFTRNGKPFLVARSQSFVIRPDRIVSDDATVTFYLDKDSIYHPNLELKYISASKELSIIRPSGKSIGTPFNDSFHEVVMYFDAMTWKVNEDKIDMKMISGEGEVKLIFESTNYFRNERYQQLQGISEVNPLYTIKQYAEQNNTKVISVSEFSMARKLNETQVRSLFLSLSSKGFLAFNPNTDKAYVKDRLYYYLSASVGKSDYDIIEFGSQLSGLPNATLDLTTYSIKMRGVARVALSDTQNVYVIPHEQEITLQKNRNFAFEGRVHAGRFDFVGKDFTFNYEDFNIHLKSIDSMSVKIPGEPEADGRIPLLPIKSVIQSVTGYLSIDRPNNKSSYQKSPEYPIFRSQGQSYVYYDYPWIYNGVYNRENFYFNVDPFTIDSLDNFKPEGLVFDGTLVSAGIFPDIKEQLSIQRDYSLGFQKVLDETGLPAYASRGTYYENLELNNSGLSGGGRIDYLSSSSISDKILFFPDSANADLNTIAMKRGVIGGVEFPSGYGSDVYMNWLPKQDKMMLYKKQINFALYDSIVDHNGDLILAKAGLTGNGTDAFEQATVSSNKIDYSGITFDSDTSDFTLKSVDPLVPALATKNMNSHIDLQQRFGEFKSNGIGSYVTFPLNQYICFIQSFKWMMDDKNVNFVNRAATVVPADSSNYGSAFVSIHPAQDSLKWYSPDASYNLSDYILRANEVKEIKVADAAILPGDGKVTINKNAAMQTLVDARVIANRETKYHTITNSTINITSRQNYSGKGDYEYVDQLNVTHLLRLTQIGVDTSKQTYANGEVIDSLNFMLSPNIQYKGTMSIQAARLAPFFKGFARANHSCPEIDINWFSFAAEIDPNGVNVPVKDPVNESGEKLYSAIWFTRDSTTNYGSFISPRKGTSDQEIISAEGLLSYNNDNRTFRIVPFAPDSDKKETKNDEPEPFNRWNSLTLHDDDCSFEGDGRINLGAKFGQFELNTIGKAILKPAEDTLYFDAMLDLDFIFNDDALKLMAEMILSYPTLPPTNDNRDVFKNSMEVILGKKDADKLNEEISLYGTPKKAPEQLQHSIFLSDVKLHWEKETLSYKNTGSIGVGYVGKVPVNRLLKGYVEIARKRSGDVFNLYLELDGNTYYYFNYQRGIMQVLSSDLKFNETITNMKPEKRVADEKGGKSPYQYLLSTERKKLEFIKRAEHRDD